MSAPIFSMMPPSFDAGSQVQINQTFQNYPSTEWAGVMWLSRGTGIDTPTSVAATAGANGSFDVNLTSAITVALAPDQYRWAFQVTKNLQTETPPCGGQGVVNILPNFALAQTPSLAQVQLALINTTIAEILADGFSSTSFNGQSQSTKDLDQLRKWQLQLQAQVLREQQAIDRARGGRDPGRVQIRFDPCATGGGQWFGWPWILPYR